MKYLRRIGISAVILISIPGIGCVSARNANDAAVEKLRKSLVSEDFGEIYRHTSVVTRAQLSEDEFVSRIRDATHQMKAVDPEMNWVRNERISYDRDVFRDDNFSSLDLGQVGKKINITLDWGTEFGLCGMDMFLNPAVGDPGEGVRVFRNCD